MAYLRVFFRSVPLTCLLAPNPEMNGGLSGRDVTCIGQSVTLMSPLMPSGWNMDWIAPVLKDNIAFLSCKETHRPPAVIISPAQQQHCSKNTQIYNQMRIL